MTFDPAHYTGFEWDAGNLAKSATKHGVAPEEAEQVFAQQPLLVYPTRNTPASKPGGAPSGARARGADCFWRSRCAETKCVSSARGR